MKLSKEFSKYQEEKKKKYLDKYKVCFLFEDKSDIKVISPAKVKILWKEPRWKTYIRKLFKL